jgi:hypothetical protein
MMTFKWRNFILYLVGIAFTFVAISCFTTITGYSYVLTGGFYDRQYVLVPENNA